ncbi:MAG: D-tyrosyl-tRNA(Tyr) deacylase [Flavobacteriales bacterium]|nr:D-tyrosyl-tRNA(Tyr) deacylase [Flavobacteriales bacterium]|tara:strand:+ start:7416 stop:7868 length:453 start_codon:yes stop_codon:yes gene_type:complete
MRAVIQRVSEASVSIDNEIVSAIDTGILIFLGIEIEDTTADSLWLANKIAHLRIFSDEKGRMNNSILDIDEEVIVVSQFTLHAKTKKGNRPSYIKSAKPEQAIPLYRQFKEDLSKLISREICSGNFGADMQVSLINDGPVTIIIDTKNKE